MKHTTEAKPNEATKIVLVVNVGKELKTNRDKRVGSFWIGVAASLTASAITLIIARTEVWELVRAFFGA